MRHIGRVLTAVAVLSNLSSGFALAQDYVSVAANALKQTRVYVAPGTEDTDSDTSANLFSKLQSTDGIVLVMLPASADDEESITSIATRLSQALDNKRIIGLAIGRNLIGFAPTLPSGVAADSMRRAKSVSNNDPITALSTFAQNVHIWQSDHPQPTPAPLESSSGIPWFVWLFLLVLVGIATIIVFVIASNRRKAAQASKERKSFRAPDQVKDLLTQIAQLRDHVTDLDLQDTVYQLCLDIEKYFRSRSKDKKGDSLIFRDHLTEVLAVLNKYIEVQDEPRYFDEPDKELRSGKASVVDYASSVLEAIRRGNAADMIGYTVSTNILQAQKYR